MMIDIKSIETMHIVPGDVVIIHVDADKVDLNSAVALATELQGRLPYNQIVIDRSDVEFRVKRKR